MSNQVHRSFESELTGCNALIAYTPRNDEPDYRSAPLPQHLFKNLTSSPSDPACDPFAFAYTCCDQFQNSHVAILVPGRRFDAYGTRHGRGSGWYDRFLSAVPRTWVRIGIAEKHSFQYEQLERKTWDQPVDFVLVHHPDAPWSIHTTETLI